MAIVTKAPNAHSTSEFKKIFLAGSIDMGRAENWQYQLSEFLKDMDVEILNPRRDNWDCVDGETMAVTSNGIKSYDEINISEDAILTYNHKEDYLEYLHASKINLYDVNEYELLEFKRGNDFFYFTGNHKVYNRVTSRHDNVGVYDAKKWIDKSDPIRIPCGKSLSNQWLNDILGREEPILDDHFKLYAWLLSEGSIFKRKDTGSYTITIAQYIKNSEKVDRIKSILQRLDIPYRYDNRQFILNQDGVNFIKGYLGFEKYKIPHWIKHSNLEQKRLFLIEYGLGDGSFVNGVMKYIAFSKKYDDFCNDMQILSYEAGLSTRKFDKTSGFGFPVSNISYHYFDKKWLTMKYSKKIQYTGKLWCPTTSNNSWVAYRNGTPFITGNSSWKQDISNLKFKEQVDWELSSIDQSDVVVFYFDPNGKAPITLLELGISLASGYKCLVCCPDGYWRRGNVQIVCEKYGVPILNNLQDLKVSLSSLIGSDFFEG